MLSAIVDRIKFELEWAFTEELEGILLVMCMVIIPASLVFLIGM
jgi:hypothetical protein